MTECKKGARDALMGGDSAFRSGRQFTSNPHRKGAARDAWACGWFLARDTVNAADEVRRSNA